MLPHTVVQSYKENSHRIILLFHCISLSKQLLTLLLDIISETIETERVLVRHCVSSLIVSRHRNRIS